MTTLFAHEDSLLISNLREQEQEREKVKQENEDRPRGKRGVVGGSREEARSAAFQGERQVIDKEFDNFEDGSEFFEEDEPGTVRELEKEEHQDNGDSFASEFEEQEGRSEEDDELGEEDFSQVVLTDTS